MRAINIVLIIIALLYYSVSLAQESTQNLTTFSVPGGTKKITKEQFLNQESQQFKRKLFPNNSDERFFKNAYTVDGILISVYDWENVEDKRPMQQTQRELTGMDPQRVKYSQITTINNTQFLIFELKDDGDLSFSFRSEVKGGKVVQGLVQFSGQDEDKAKKILDNLLKSIRFNVN